MASSLQVAHRLKMAGLDLISPEQGLAALSTTLPVPGIWNLLDSENALATELFGR